MYGSQRTILRDCSLTTRSCDQAQVSSPLTPTLGIANSTNTASFTWKLHIPRSIAAKTAFYWSSLWWPIRPCFPSRPSLPAGKLHFSKCKEAKPASYWPTPMQTERFWSWTTFPRFHDFTWYFLPLPSLTTGRPAGGPHACADMLGRDRRNRWFCCLGNRWRQHVWEFGFPDLRAPVEAVEMAWPEFFSNQQREILHNGCSFALPLQY